MLTKDEINLLLQGLEAIEGKAETLFWFSNLLLSQAARQELEAEERMEEPEDKADQRKQARDRLTLLKAKLIQMREALSNAAMVGG